MESNMRKQSFHIILIMTERESDKGEIHRSKEAYIYPQDFPVGSKMDYRQLVVIYRGELLAYY